MLFYYWWPLSIIKRSVSFCCTYYSICWCNYGSLLVHVDVHQYEPNLLKAAATIAAGSLLIILVAVTRGTENLPSTMGDSQIGTVANLGKVLYNDYLLPFELTSILLLAAMVGAVMLGKKSVE